MNKLLFLDDYRQPIDCAFYMYRYNVDCKIYHNDWSIVRSYGQFKNWIIENGIPEFVSLDYDLTDVEELKEILPKDEWFNSDTNKDYTGLDCVLFLIEYCKSKKCAFPKYAIHSSNTDGKKLIQKTILEYQFN